MARVSVALKRVPVKEKRKGKKHQVFQPSFDAKEVQGEDKVLQVLDYMLHNPVSKKCMLVSDYIAYPYSSASAYELGKKVEFL